LKTSRHSEDVSNLLNQYTNGLHDYHEIRRQDANEEIRSRWPLLKEIGKDNNRQ